VRYPFQKTERQKWASHAGFARPRPSLGLSALDPLSRDLYERALPRNVLAPRFQPDRPPVNYWMAPYQLARHGFVPGQIILGKFAGQFIGHIDDRPQVTIAGARSGKTSTVLGENWPAPLRRALGHNVFVLDPFGQTGEQSAPSGVRVRA
jgi:type IV secretion system protein VirD4